MDGQVEIENVLSARNIQSNFIIGWRISDPQLKYQICGNQKRKQKFLFVSQINLITHFIIHKEN